MVITGRTRNGRADCSFCPPENPAVDAGLSQFKKVNILLFCPVVLSSVFLQNFRLNIWRVVRVVEGAALEMLCCRKEPRVRIPNSPPKSPVTMRVCWTFLFFSKWFVLDIFCRAEQPRTGTEQSVFSLMQPLFRVRNNGIFFSRFYLAPLALKTFGVRQKHSAQPWPVRRTVFDE